MTWDKHRLTDALKHIVDSNREFTTWTVSTPHLLLLLKKAVEEKVVKEDEVAEYYAVVGKVWAAVDASVYSG